MSNVLDRAVRILKLLMPEGSTKEWGASEIARQSGIPVGTVHRILLDLKRMGVVTQNEETKKFRLGLLLMKLGFAVRDSLSIVELARPVLKDLAEKTQETVHFSIQDGSAGVLIDKIDSIHQLRIVEPVGMITPLTKGALKKACLAFLPEQEINMIVDQIEKLYTSKNSEFNRAQIMAELADIRLKGYAISYGEITAGTVAIGSPIFDFKGRVAASIGITGPDSRFSPDEMPGKIEAVKKAAATLTKSMGGTS